MHPKLFLGFNLISISSLLIECYGFLTTLKLNNFLQDAFSFSFPTRQKNNVEHLQPVKLLFPNLQFTVTESAFCDYHFWVIMQISYHIIF